MESQQPTSSIHPPSVGAPIIGDSPSAKTPRNIWICAGLMGLGFVPILLAFLENLWSRPHYQFCPLVMAGAVFLVWDRQRDLPRPLAFGSLLVAGPILAFALILLGAGTVLWSPWFGAVALLFALSGLFWWRGGWPMFKAMIPALLLLLTIIPPPMNLDVNLTLKLRHIAVVASAKALDFLEITHVVNGNVIELPTQRMLVEEACSGINSVLSASAVCLFYLLWRRRPYYQIAPAMVLNVSFVLLGNVGRIIVGAYSNFYYHIDLLTGWTHQAIGFFLYAFYLVLILSADHLLYFFFEPIQEEQGESQVKPVPAPQPVSVSNLFCFAPSRVALGLCIVFAVFGLFGAGAWIRDARLSSQAKIVGSGTLRPNAVFTLPDKIGKWQRIQSVDPKKQRVETLGGYSQSWHYQFGNLVASVALDYPFKGYHDLAVCYTNQGWAVVSDTVHVHSEDTKTPPTREIDMQREAQRRGLLMISTLDENGQWMEKPSSVRKDFVGRLQLMKKEPVTYRIQTLMTSFLPLHPEQRQSMIELFVEARTVLGRQLIDQMEKKK